MMAALLLLLSTGLFAQSYHVVVSPDIPADAAALLTQRVGQMLQAGGFSLADDGTPITVTGAVTDRMETPGSMSQVVLQIEIKASTGTSEGVFPLKGVGADEADAWLRAVKQFLPRSKAAQAFLEQLK